MASDTPEARRLILLGLRELRGGRIGAALEAWDSAQAAEPGCQDAEAFCDYVKKNRIRIAVHLGRAQPSDGEAIVLPKGWPPPPPGLCDPLPTEPPPAATAAPSAARISAPPAAGEDEPYAALEIGADADTSAEPRPSVPSTGSNEYAVLEIVMEDDEDPIEVSGALPPPPEALDAPEIVLEAPKEDRAPVEAPADYVMDRGNQEALDVLGLERLAGPIDAEGAPGAAPTPAPSQASPGAGTYAEDAPTIARDAEASPPRAFPGQSAPAAAKGSPAHDTLDRFPTSPGPTAPRPPPGASPHATLMGVGLSPFAAGVTPDFGQSLPAAPTPLGRPQPAPPQVPGPRTPPMGSQAGVPTRPTGDFSGAEGSFSEDIPTRMRARNDSGPMGRAMIRPMPLEDPGDYTAGEGSFSDDLPTHTRSVPPTPAPSPAQAVTPAPGRREDPGDFVSRESSFSDDMPTRARDGLLGPGRPAVRPVPLSGEPSGERTFEEQVTLERRGQRRASNNDEIEALLDPERGLALARRFHAEKAYERSQQVVERLQERYGDLPGCEELAVRNQRALELALLVQLGPLDSLAVPRAPSESLSQLDLDPRAAFLFTRIDGTLSLEDLLDISGMSRYETTQILLKLRDLGLLVFEPGR